MNFMTEKEGVLSCVSIREFPSYKSSLSFMVCSSGTWSFRKDHVPHFEMVVVHSYMCSLFGRLLEGRGDKQLSQRFHRQIRDCISVLLQWTVRSMGSTRFGALGLEHFVDLKMRFKNESKNKPHQEAIPPGHSDGAAHSLTFAWWSSSGVVDYSSSSSFGTDWIGSNHSLPHPPTCPGAFKNKLVKI